MEDKFEEYLAEYYPLLDIKCKFKGYSQYLVIATLDYKGKFEYRCYIKFKYNRKLTLDANLNYICYNLDKEVLKMIKEGNNYNDGERYFEIN